MVNDIDLIVVLTVIMTTVTAMADADDDEAPKLSWDRGGYRGPTWEFNPGQQTLKTFDPLVL